MYIKRNLHDTIKDHLKRKEYTLITGARQCGKTSLINALATELKNMGESVFYVSFEDPMILDAVDTHPEEIFSFAARPAGTARIYLFIDEVQYARDPSGFLKYLFDKYEDKVKVIATGSSAFYMDTKFRDSLAGRKRIFELPTLDFDEWLLFRGLEKQRAELEMIRKIPEYISAISFELKGFLEEYLLYGGYPAVALEDNKEERILLLQELKNSFLRRDIQESGIGSMAKLYKMLPLLAQQTGQLVNRNELANTVGVDNKTVEKYLFILQKSFHIRLVKPFFANIRKEITKMPKVYFSDTGMINSILNRFFDIKIREDKGALFENYVYKRLSTVYGPENIRFWRTTDQKEIDFVITTSHRGGWAYETKVSCQPVKKSIRENFLKSYPGYEIQVVSFDISEKCLWILKI